MCHGNSFRVHAKGDEDDALRSRLDGDGMRDGAAYEAALIVRAGEVAIRRPFGLQLVQDLLSKMIANITASQLP